MSETESYKYDVAISFLARDLTIAKDLADRLEGLRVFVYDREKEELLGGDGMEKFGEIFSSRSALNVVLHRAGWGDTKWTAFEERHIKTRALEDGARSVFVVRLDDEPLRRWIPPYHVYASEATDTRDQQVGAIRLRAKELGAEVRKLSAAEKAIQQVKRKDAERRREERLRSPTAGEEIDAEAQRLFQEILRIGGDIDAGQASLRLSCGAYGDQCVVSSSKVSVALVVMRVGNTLRQRVLRVNWWQGRHELPSSANPHPGGSRHLSADEYEPVIGEDDAWAWKWDARSSQSPRVVFLFSVEPQKSTQLAEEILTRLVEKASG